MPWWLCLYDIDTVYQADGIQPYVHLQTPFASDAKAY